ncbi:MAG TPA: MBL fold metallo-hydrolase [Thermoanaerobaculia bacterium]|jgi:pyrroloquinoline quinone biosynthesis protein B|nr:MBL fold metallo-hydrolase [Thermoanaerobaculia bacterium]
MRILALLPLAVLLMAPSPAPSGLSPRIVVLGTVQDGGMPQAGCDCAHCSAARKNPALARHVASLAIYIPKTDHVYLVDATPDLPAQIEQIHGFHHHPAGKTDRAPVDGVLLTHAHMGHYLGLAHFGFESLNTKGIPTWASPRMAEFLRTNGPWSQLVRLGNITLKEIQPGGSSELEDGVSIKAFAVPHRDEYTDTLAFLIRGPHKTLLYVPDTDSWKAWPQPLPEVLAAEKVDIALLDATFYSADELPDRDVSKIKHPLMTDTMDLLEPLLKERKPEGRRLRVYFTHMNHTNPALDSGGAAARAIEARGFKVLAEEQELDL